MQFKNLIYILTCLSFSVILGAAIYEHIALWPAAFSEPPKSLAVFQGDYKLNAPAFWMPIHPITLLLFIVTLIISWRTQRRKHILIPLVAYGIILVITFSFFVPELISIIGSAYTETVNENLQGRAQLWITLSIARSLILFGMAIVLYLGLTKPALAISNNKV